MVCYAIPLLGAILCHGWREKAHKTEPKYLWLNLMLMGGATFGVVDHLWNGELFLIGPNLLMDLALGFVITAAIVFSWLVVVKVLTPAPQASEVKG